MGRSAGRTDLPVPLWLFVFGAATALIVSFVALSALWMEPRFEGRPTPSARPSWIQSILTNRGLEWTIRIVMLVFFVVVAMASARRVSDTETIGPIVVYAWFWVGLTIAHALFGNLWATLSPFDTIGRLVGLDDDERVTPPRPYPQAWGKWPAAVLLFAFVWVELVQPFGSDPRSPRDPDRRLHADPDRRDATLRPPGLDRERGSVRRLLRAHLGRWHR